MLSVAVWAFAAVPVAAASPALPEMEDALAEYRSARALSELRAINRPQAEATSALPHRVERWRPFVELEFPEEWVEWALRIIACESRGDPTARSGRSSATGLFQFLRSTWNWVSESTGAPSYASGGPYNAVWNIRNAAWLLANGGTSHWQCTAAR